jgi:hypothetical protein
VNSLLSLCFFFPLDTLLITNLFSKLAGDSDALLLSVIDTLSSVGVHLHSAMFKLDSETDSPGPPAGDCSSSRGYRNTTYMTEAVSGFIGDLRRGSDQATSDSDGPGRNDSERRNNHQRRNHNQRKNDNWYRDPLRDARRDYFQQIALGTLEICDDGEYFPPGQNGPYDLREKILWTDENTRYYGPDDGDGGEILESEFIAASKPYDDDNLNATPKDRTRVQSTVSPPENRAANTLDNTQTKIYIRGYSTFVAARKLFHFFAQDTDPSFNKKIGVLNFGSAKIPGGEFISGSQDQVRFFRLPYLSYD